MATRTTTTTRRRRAPADDSPLAILRREAAAANREKHESAYFLHVVLPLAAKGYPRPRPHLMIFPGHKHHVDYGWIRERIAVELQGQIWRKGGHSTGKGITRDAWKLNELTCMGWKLLVFTPEQLESGEALEWTERALRHAGQEVG